MKLVNRIRLFRLNAAALRTLGMVFAMCGLAAVWIRQILLGGGSLTNSELLDAMQTSPEVMTYATITLVFQVLEACAVPVFAFLLVEGVGHARGFGRYFLGILGTAVLCQLPYNVLMTGSLLMIRGLNPAFALVMSLVMLYFFQRFPEKSASHILIKAFALVFAFLWSNLLGVSHGAACVILTAVLWGLRGKQNLQTFLGIAVAMACSVFDLFYMASPLAFLLIHFYDPEGWSRSRTADYFAYPVCLLIFSVLVKVM